MTDKPNIAALRIDERLVHGQGQLWIKTLGVNTVIVANDEAANDPIQQTLMKTVIPKTIAMRFFTVQHTCDVIYKASPKQVMFIICKSAEDALKLVEGGVPVTEINVGNIHRAPGKQEVSPYIALGEEDRAALRTLKEKYNVTFNTKSTPTGADTAGSVLVANALGVNLGTMMAVGIPVALVSTVVAGIIWGKIIGNKIYTKLPANVEEIADIDKNLPSFGVVLTII